MLKLGLWLPTYGGWLRQMEEEERLPTYDYAKEVALRAEKAGLHSLWIPDHLLNPIKGEHSPSLEAWTLAAGIAEATDEIVISHTTLCEAFRYPAVLAKQAATMCDLSCNRFWLSLGAGWYKREYSAYGLVWHEHDERVKRAREAIKLINRLWTEDRVDFSGKFYAVKNGIVEPKPEPIPPIWYGGNSEASRELVASEADGWLMGRAPIQEVERNITDMDKRLQKQERGKIEFAVPALTFVRDSDKQAKAHVKSYISGSDDAMYRAIKAGLVGSPNTMANKIKKLDEVGIDHLLLHFTPTIPEFERFVDSVLPLLN